MPVKRSDVRKDKRTKSNKIAESTKKKLHNKSSMHNVRFLAIESKLDLLIFS